MCFSKVARSTNVYASSPSPGRRSRVVHDRLNHRRGSLRTNWWTTVPLPTPPGPDTTMINGGVLLAGERLEERRALLIAQAAHPTRLADADLLHRAPSLHLADTGQRLEHRDDLHLADDLVLLG